MQVNTLPSCIFFSCQCILWYIMHTHIWGGTNDTGEEFWDSKPIFPVVSVGLLDFAKLLFYPKKWFLYRYLRHAYCVWEHANGADASAVFRVLDVGAATGSSVVDIARLLGPRAYVDGLDVQKHMVESGQKGLVDAGVADRCSLALFDGNAFPCSSETYDAVYTSDVLGHVVDAQKWLCEVSRVLKPYGALAMFTESALGKHAFVRKYLWYKGCNIDPHAQFHISLHSKTALKQMLEKAGFDIADMRTLFWASFFVHPDEFHAVLQAQHRFHFLRVVNHILFIIKKALHPFSTAAAELYGLAEGYVIGSKVEGQGYIVLARKKGNK